MNKADILHESAERIEQLERQLAEMADAHSRRHSLQSSMFVQSSACIMVVHSPTGYVTDASERYLQHALFERSWLVGRRCLPPLQVMQSNPMCLARPIACNSDRSESVLCKPEGDQLQPTVHKPQSETTVRLLKQLYSGEIDAMHAIWYCDYMCVKRVRDAERRPSTHLLFIVCVVLLFCLQRRSQFGDGRMMERAIHSWVTEWTEHEDGSRTPLYVVGLVSTSETVCVE